MPQGIEVDQRKDWQNDQPHRQLFGSGLVDNVEMDPIRIPPPFGYGPQDNTNGHRLLAQHDRIGDFGVATGERERIAEEDEIIQVPAMTDPLLPLNARDVAAFIINKMIGTGIFVSPATVLILTRSKSEAIGLWIAGFLYVLVSMTVYLEFARRLPHTGGEIIYLDETLPRPMLLAHTLYSFYFITMYSTARNCMQFGVQVLSAANVPYPQNFEPSNKLLRFIGIIVLTSICLLHYFSGKVGRAMNQVFAFVKIGLLLIVLVAGIRHAVPGFRRADWSQPANPNVSSSATAFLYIVFSFAGWENATFVSGEIPSYDVLRRGCLSAVWIVGLLYVFVNLVFLLAVPYEMVEQGRKYTDYPAFFFGGGDKATITWAILIALSAFGSILSITYTCARVKQVIGKTNILPWSRLWATSSKTAADAKSTPLGGLLLHWIFCVLLIICSSVIKTQSESIAFSANLQAYGGGVVGVFMSIGFLFLYADKGDVVVRGRHIFRQRKIPTPRNRLGKDWDAVYRSKPTKFYFLKSKWWRIPFVSFYFIINCYIVIVPLIGPYVNGKNVPLEVQGTWYAAVVGTLAGVALLYYCAVIGFTERERERECWYSGLFGPHRSVLRAAGMETRMVALPTHDSKYGYRKVVELTVSADTKRRSYLYWVFGGSNKTHTKEPTLLVDLWNRLLDR